MSEKRPLALDVDGTFLRTDMLFECFWAGLGRDPARTLLACVRLFRNPAALKQELADIAPLRTELLPVEPAVKALAEQSLAEGREVVLASASDASLVQQLAADHGLSSRSFASDGRSNLKAEAKAAALVEAFGEEGFDYAGNEAADLKIWQHGARAIVVGGKPNLRQQLAAMGKAVTDIPAGWHMRDLLRALRPHQWVKNVLLLLPMLAAHDFSLSTLVLVLLGMVAFSAAASSIYIVNDLLDLEADRLHATKHKRPFASGAVPIRAGMAAFFVLAAIALGLGAALGMPFLAVVVGYMSLSLAYSLKLKRMRWIDIATLAALYTIRVVAGAAAGRVDVSIFMLIFIFPVFVTLGGVKRLTELTLAKSDERLPGRGYSRADKSDLRNVSALGVVGALLMFFLYTLSDQARLLYPTRWILWLAMIPLSMWLLRMLRLGYFGKQDYDPIVFAMRDKRGIGLLMITLSLMFYAAGLWQKWYVALIQ